MRDIARDRRAGEGPRIAPSGESNRLSAPTCLLQKIANEGKHACKKVGAFRCQGWSRACSPFPEEDRIATLNPSAARRFAAPAPMPLPPAVTIAIFSRMIPNSIWNGVSDLWRTGVPHVNTKPDQVKADQKARGR